MNGLNGADDRSAEEEHHRFTRYLLGHGGGTHKKAPTSQQGYFPATPRELRNDRNAARSSSVKMSGTSQAAK